MKISLKSGYYVVAVSGGVDSVVLLDLLANTADLHLTVAHFDHGIRPDSAQDREFVRQLASDYGLPFDFAEGKLGPVASEATAREARYAFLRKVQSQAGAQAIITAHHQDDVIETAILNMLRGTGRKGLTALSSRPDTLRPLLGVNKQEILDYAHTNNLEWREDATNQDTAYLRNHIRHKILPRVSVVDRDKLVTILTSLSATNNEADELLSVMISQQAGNKLDRRWFNQLPHAVAKEVMASWLRTNDQRSFGRKTLERLVVAAKTGQAGKQFPVQAGHNMQVEADRLVLI